MITKLSIIFNIPPQVIGWKKPKFADNVLKWMNTQWLGKNVCKLIFSREKMNLDNTIKDLLSYKMIVKLDVLGTSMKTRMRGHVDGSNIITPKCCRRGWRDAYFRKERLYLK